MQRQADQLLASLREFIDQPDYPTLILSANDASIIMPNRILGDMDRQDEETYYLLFPHNCQTAVAYMDAIAASLTQQWEVLNTELPAQNSEALPPLPVSMNDGRYPPAQRLRAAIEYFGEHLPGGGTIVWGLLPAELHDPPGYRALVESLLALTEVEPWMERHRFLLRDLAEQPFLAPELLEKKNDRVLVMDIDFSNERWAQDLVETASDKSLPKDERMNAFFQLGVLDFGFGRLAQALEKFGVCFNFFHDTGNRLMQVLCLNMAADTMKQAGRREDALKFYQQTLALGVEDKNLPIIQMATFGAGKMSLELSKNQDAEGYLKHADDTAGKMNNPYAKCDAMEQRGLVAWRLGKIDEAVDVWLKGKDLAKQFDYKERAASILDWLIALSRQSGLQHRVAEFEAERAALGVPPRGAPLDPGAPGGTPPAAGGAPGSPGASP